MVASGVSHRLDILSPNSWKTEACEHNAADKEHTQKVITHELVHVYHGQQNPIQDFSGADDLGWFIEGIAVLVSGQLNAIKEIDLKEAKAQNKLPVKLKDAWSGKYRYSVSGSLVKFIENKYGKVVIFKLLKQTAEEKIFSILNTTPENLLKDWKESI